MTNTNKTTRKTVTPKVSDDVELGYSYYSNVLKKPFTTIAELRNAEEAYYTELKAKEDKVAQKKADAAVVEEAFKALNAARKSYKTRLSEVTTRYTESLIELKNNFENVTKEIKDDLATAEERYLAALKAFTDKYEQYHITLKDGDFETTISNQTTTGYKAANKAEPTLASLFDIFFNL